MQIYSKKIYCLYRFPYNISLVLIKNSFSIHLKKKFVND